MNTERELTNDELDAISGGATACKYDLAACISITFGPVDPQPGSGGGGGGGGNAGAAIGAWNTLLGQYGLT
jgi:bacteriocin-like protein